MESMVTPERSLQQRLEALERANGIRSHRAQVKRDLKLRAVAGRDVLLSDDSRLATMKVWDVLVAMPKVGRVKANKWLARTRISPSKTVGGLTDRQRGELLALLH